MASNSVWTPRSLRPISITLPMPPCCGTACAPSRVWSAILMRNYPGVRGFTRRTLSARRRMQAIQRMTARQREQQQTPKYRELIGITEQVVRNARQVIDAALRVRRLDAVKRAVIEGIGKEIASYCKLADRVTDQTRRRVLQGETVPAE